MLVLSRRVFTVILVLGICLLTLLSKPVISYASLVLEGQIVDNGEKLAAGQVVEMTLRIYDDEFCGKLLFEEKKEVVTSPEKPLFTFEKGEVTVPKRTANLKAETLWVEVESNGQIMTPRLSLAELDTTADLTGDSLSLRAAGLRDAGDPTMIIGNNGVTLSNLLTAEGITDCGLSYAPDGAIVSGVNNYGGALLNFGGYFKALGNSGMGVYGEAANTGDVTNYGGYFQAKGKSGQGVSGIASGSYGRGVSGIASGSFGQGVYGYASSTSIYNNYGGFFECAGIAGRGVYGYASNNADNTNYGGFFECAGVAGWGVVGIALGSEGRGVVGHADGDSGIGVFGRGGLFDFYADGNKTNFGPFTGAHEVSLADDVYDVKPGLIMSVTGETRIRKDEEGNISLSSTLATVTLARKARDREVYGVLVSETQLPEDHWCKPAVGERFGIVNALGEGRVWVSDINGPVASGDYITTSAVAGYGQRQDDDLLHSYTLGKAIEKVDWKNVTETVEYNGRTIKIYLISVAYTSG